MWFHARPIVFRNHELRVGFSDRVKDKGLRAASSRTLEEAGKKEWSWEFRV